jgi:uncharacterized membrane protein (DUF4010 family)
MKRYFAETIGTFCLVFAGTGALVISLRRVLMFDLLFLAWAESGQLAHGYFCQWGFLSFSTVGGLVSSAGTTASAAALAARGEVAPNTAALAVILTSMASALIDLPLVFQQTRSWALTIRLAAATRVAVLTGLAVSVAASWM